MAQKQITSDSVWINSKKYTLNGDIVGKYISKSPGKVNIGDDSYANELALSNWIFSAPFYIGKEEMDESVDFNRCWWTNCLVDYKNHILLPRKATEITIRGDTQTNTNPTGSNDPDTAWADDANIYDGNPATYATNSPGAETKTEYIEATITAHATDYVIVYASTQTPDAGDEIDIDVYDSEWHDVYEGTISQSASIYKGIPDGRLTITKIRVAITPVNACECRVHYVAFGALSGTSTFVNFANFNGHTYFATANFIYRLGADRSCIYPVWYAGGYSITRIIPSLNSRLYVYMGDSVNYYYMNTGEFFTQSDSANAYWGIQWDDQLWKLKSDGTFSASSDPDAAGPTWSDEGDITDIADQIENLLIGYDSSGNTQIYCATNSYLKIYDADNDKWLDTGLKLPDHPNGGKGATYWNDGIYLSYGLGVKKYVVGNTATISDVGLDQNDGLPIEYNGEVVKLYGDASMKHMFASVDASQTSGNSYSGLYTYDGIGWRCWWIDDSYNGAMHDIIVSSDASSYAIYWDCGGSIYYIDIHRGISNAQQLAGVQEYEATGEIESPWFDAGTAAFKKLFKRLTNWANNITTTEWILIAYRTNKTYTTWSAGWTTIETLNTTGENGQNVEELASGAGVNFNTIQFRIAMGRGSTTTLSPDLQSLTPSYRKITQGYWQWIIPIKVDTKTQHSNLETAAENETDVPLLFREDSTNETHYVEIFLPSSWIKSGQDFSGVYTITALEA